MVEEGMKDLQPIEAMLHKPLKLHLDNLQFVLSIGEPDNQLSLLSSLLPVNVGNGTFARFLM